jgi:hypothetical protein
MHIQSQKLQLMKLILETENAEVLELIRHLLEKEDQKDFWDSLTKQQKQEIHSGISEVENKETLDYETVVGKHRK